MTPKEVQKITTAIRTLWFNVTPETVWADLIRAQDMSEAIPMDIPAPEVEGYLGGLMRMCEAVYDTLPTASDQPAPPIKKKRARA